MTNALFHHVTRHAKAFGCHIHKHHKKYLLGIFGGFALAKMVIVFVAGFGFTTLYHDTFADQESGCVMTGQYFTGETQICTLVQSGYYTGGQEECTVVQSGYYTGGTLDESGTLTGQTYVDPVEDCFLTGQTYVDPVEDCIMTGGYYTGGTLLCPEVEQESNGLTGGDGVCGSSDIQLITLASGIVLKGVIPLQVTYLTTDCTSTILTFQLRDHNAQWVPVATVSSGATGTSFDSLLLSGIRNSSGLMTSGFYHVLSGSTYLYTGIASGLYTAFASGYTIRLLDGQQVLATGNVFTIDNQAPTLTGIQLTSSDAVSGYVKVGDEVELNFIASEELTNIIVHIAGVDANFHDEDFPLYSFIQELSSSSTQGVLIYTITYTDAAGNAGAVSGTGTLTFDTTDPVLSGLNLTGTVASGLTLSFVTNENTRSSFQYQTTGVALVILSGTTYQTGHSYLFSGIQVDTLYAFRISVQDTIGHVIYYSGTFTITASGVIDLDYLQIYSSDLGTGDVITSGGTLRQEIVKFNACKSGLTYTPITLTIGRNAYILQMPEFRKSYVKQIVNAFTLFIMDKVERKARLTTTEISEITRKFNNFLIILKLLRDDDGECKQNLSNYHITQFVSVMSEYKIDLK